MASYAGSHLTPKRYAIHVIAVRRRHYHASRRQPGYVMITTTGWSFAASVIVTITMKCSRRWYAWHVENIRRCNTRSASLPSLRGRYHVTRWRWLPRSTLLLLTTYRCVVSWFTSVNEIRDDANSANWQVVNFTIMKKEGRIELVITALVGGQQAVITTALMAPFVIGQHATTLRHRRYIPRLVIGDGYYYWCDGQAITRHWRL